MNEIQFKRSLREKLQEKHDQYMNFGPNDNYNHGFCAGLKYVMRVLEDG